MKRIKLGKLIVAIAVCQLAGFIGSVFTIPAISTWYAELMKPWFTPPGWIFGPAWIILYTLMGIALYIVWQKGLKQKDQKTATELFIIQLIYNAVWSILFFGFHALALSFIEILILWALIAKVTLDFYRIDKWAGKLMVPYLAWVTFASILTYSVWRLNP